MIMLHQGLRPVECPAKMRCAGDTSGGASRQLTVQSTNVHHLSSGPRISRRQALVRAGALTFGGLSLADWLRVRAQAAGTSAARDGRAVIQVFMGGGPSHIDLYDLKPAAPAEFRGEFRPISTALPGVHIGEHLPHLARALDHVAIVRSVSACQRRASAGFALDDDRLSTAAVGSA